MTDIKGYVKLILEKFLVLKVNLVRIDGNWKEWDFLKLVEILRKWTDRDLKEVDNSCDKGQKHENLCEKR